MRAEVIVRLRAAASHDSEVKGDVRSFKDNFRRTRREGIHHNPEPGALLEVMRGRGRSRAGWLVWCAVVGVGGDWSGRQVMGTGTPGEGL